MRRVLSILLLAIMGWSMAGAPVLAAAQGEDANLPACCRGNGAHGCSMRLMHLHRSSASPHLTAVTAKCPCYPCQTASHQSHDAGTPAAQTFYAALLSHPAAVAQTESLWRIARDRSRQKRGPPLA